MSALAEKPSREGGRTRLVVLFVVYLGLIAPSFGRQVAGALVGASLVLEIAQYGFAAGSSDVSDVIVNAAGVLAGLRLLSLARNRFQTRTAAVLTQSARS